MKIKNFKHLDEKTVAVHTASNYCSGVFVGRLKINTTTSDSISVMKADDQIVIIALEHIIAIEAR